MADLEQIVSERNGHRAVFNGSWYRGPHTNFIASKAERACSADGVDRFVMQGWGPPHPFIRKNSQLTTFGSCFAGHITDYLVRRGYDVGNRNLNNQSHIIRFGEGIVNTFAVLQQLQWAIEGRQFSDNLWFSADKQIAPVDPIVQRDTREIIRTTDVFIITLGLSEIWYDKRTGEALWRAVPAHLFDESIHSFRVSSHQENLENIRSIFDVIIGFRPEAKVIFTVSPIPLMATFRPISCITANSVSKSILRSAVDEFIRGCDDDRASYFPSYEIVSDFFVDAFEDDNRHPRQDVIDFVMQTFERHYCCP